MAAEFNGYDKDGHPCYTVGPTTNKVILELREEALRECMALHQHIRDFRQLRQFLPVQQIPDHVLHEYGMKTNDELVLEVLKERGVKSD